MADWRPYEEGYPPTSEGWYTTAPWPPSAPARAPPSEPAHAQTHWAVESSRYLHSYNDYPPFPHHFPPPPSTSTSSSLHPSLHQVVGEYPLPPPIERSQGSYESTSTNSALSYEYEELKERGPEGAAQPSSVDSKGFISKLFHMLDNPQLYSDVISWDPDGTTFVVHHSERMSEVVLPSLFSHNTIASFTRQLNVYQFRRLTTAQLREVLGTKDVSHHSGWDGSPHFRRGDKSSLHLLLPRQSKSRLAKKAAREERLATQKQQEAERTAAPKPGRTLGGSWSRAE